MRHDARFSNAQSLTLSTSHAHDHAAHRSRALRQRLTRVIGHMPTGALTHALTPLADMHLHTRPTKVYRIKRILPRNTTEAHLFPGPLG